MGFLLMVMGEPVNAVLKIALSAMSGTTAPVQFAVFVHTVLLPLTPPDQKMSAARAVFSIKIPASKVEQIRVKRFFFIVIIFTEFRFWIRKICGGRTVKKFGSAKKIIPQNPSPCGQIGSGYIKS